MWPTWSLTSMDTMSPRVWCRSRPDASLYRPLLDPPPFRYQLIMDAVRKKTSTSDSFCSNLHKVT